VASEWTDCVQNAGVRRRNERRNVVNGAIACHVPRHGV